MSLRHFQEQDIANTEKSNRYLAELIETFAQPGSYPLVDSERSQVFLQWVSSDFIYLKKSKFYMLSNCSDLFAPFFRRKIDEYLQL